LWASTSDSLARAVEANGYWIDNGNKPYGGAPVPSPWNEQEWAKAMRSFLDSGKASNPKAIYVPNTTCFNSNYMYQALKNSSVDGLAGEGYFGQYDSYGWVVHVSRGLELDRLGKGWLPFVDASLIDTLSAKHRMFMLSSFLLGKGSHSFLDDCTAYYLNWFPEWNLQAGYPLELKHLAGQYNPGSYGQDGDTLALRYRGGKAGSENGWFYRRYSNALVLVNPEPGQSYTINIAGLDARGFLKATPSEPVGGNIHYFTVLPSGKTNGTITYTPVSGSITLPPREGWILIADTNYKAPDSSFEPLAVSGNPGSYFSAHEPARELDISISPNPFYLRTSISMQSHRNSADDKNATLKIFDIRGKLVLDLIPGKGSCANEGRPVVWEAGNLSAGVYVIQANAGGQTVSRKVLLQK
jgi:hypothetical protein